MHTVPELFGSMVFDDKVMRARLSSDVYHSLKETIRKGKKLDLSVANAVADAMCAWAVELSLARAGQPRDHEVLRQGADPG